MDDEPFKDRVEDGDCADPSSRYAHAHGRFKRFDYRFSICYEF